jgi:hypothetical protein
MRTIRAGGEAATKEDAMDKIDPVTRSGEISIIALVLTFQLGRGGKFGDRRIPN